MKRKIASLWISFSFKNNPNGSTGDANTVSDLLIKLVFK